MSLAARLKVFRSKAGLSQEKLGEAVGVSPLTIYRWERGERQPKADMLPMIAKALNISVSELVGEDLTPQNTEIETQWNNINNHPTKDEIALIENAGTILFQGGATVEDGVLEIGYSAPIDMWEDDTCFEMIVNLFKSKRKEALDLYNAKHENFTTKIVMGSPLPPEELERRKKRN